MTNEKMQGMTRQLAEAYGPSGRRLSELEPQRFREDPRLKNARQVTVYLDDVSDIERRILKTLTDAGIPAQRAEAKSQVPYYPEPCFDFGDSRDDRSAARSRMLKRMNNHGKPWQRYGKGKR